MGWGKEEEGEMERGKDVAFISARLPPSFPSCLPSSPIACCSPPGWEREGGKRGGGRAPLPFPPFVTVALEGEGRSGREAERSGYIRGEGGGRHRRTLAVAVHGGGGTREKI